MAVTNFYDSSYFKINKIALSCVGLWPYQAKVSKYCTLAIGFYGMGCLCIPQIAYICRVSDDADSIFECLPTAAGASICTVKAMSFICMPEKIKVLLERVQQDWNLLTSDPDREVLKCYAERSRRLTLGYIIFAIGPLVAFVSMPIGARISEIISPTNLSRSTSLPYPGEFLVDQNKYYDTILIIEYIACYIGFIIALGVDTIYILFIEHICGMFAVVSCHLEKMGKHKFKSLALENLYSQQVDHYYRDIVRCIKLHSRIIRSATMVESVFAAFFFFDVGIGSLLQSASCVMIMTRLDRTSEVMKFSAAMAGQTLRLFFNSWTGQKLIDHSTQICTSIYNGIWYKATPRERRLLILFLMRSQVPCSVTVAKLYVINMKNFGVVLKTSMSYCTLMASFRETTDVQ